MQRIHILVILMLAAAALVPFRSTIRGFLPWCYGAEKPKTVQQRVDQYGKAARARLAPAFKAAGVAYPPRRVDLIALKDEQRMEIFAAGPNGKLRFICAYPILAASGGPGPKLREGDFQVPEGFYRIDWLHPNSGYHLAMHVNYPNEFDRRMARRDGRKKLGGDIMVHGSAVSAGCLAMGDQGIEDLFILVADTGTSCCSLLISPVDFRVRSSVTVRNAPSWVKALHKEIAAKMKALPPTQTPRRR